MAPEAFLPDRVELELAGANKTASQVSEYLRKVVHRGELGPGDRLPAERQLALTLGVSRDTLREALLHLERAGYLMRRRGVTGGAFITDLDAPFTAWRADALQDRARFHDMWDLREAVEIQIARLAASRRTAADLAALKETDAALRDTTSRAEFRRTDLLFHGRLAEAARSPRLAALMYAARGELFSPVEAKVIAARAQRAADGHQAVVAAIGDRKPDAAEAHMREHLHAARGEMKKALGMR
ncbi:MAG TPA: FCD domain-containing protein [Mycobacteriales bacterium]|nr:FCD domain-containing protein [Mycobacteriales bacterium]